MVEIVLRFIIQIYYYFEIYRFIMILKFVKTILKKTKKKKKEKEMTWPLTLCNVSATTLNSMFQGEVQTVCLCFHAVLLTQKPL